ncbi:MAG: rRNA maturation RNase YbeY [Phycisphaerae bacterium]|nr:rRNA maturation RNase YbeY [Phycisphaerae bacterium]
MTDKNGETAGGSEITISNRQKRIDISASRLRRLVEFVATAEGHGIDSIDVAVVDSDEIASLNGRYLGKDEVTDVLSFDLSEAGSRGISAQIIVCGDVACEVGPRQGLSADDELMLYVIHGLLHLMGYNDAEDEQAERMKTRQEQILAEFNRARKLTDDL